MTSAEVDTRIEEYQVASIQLLEDIPMQYIRERMHVDPYTDPNRYDELELKKTESQNTLNDLGCTLVAQNLLSSPTRTIFDAALKLLISLLEGGNKNVQVTFFFFQYCLSNIPYLLKIKFNRINLKNTFIVLEKNGFFIRSINVYKTVLLRQRTLKLT